MVSTGEIKTDDANDAGGVIVANSSALIKTGGR
jgi:hypothetical protein